MSFYRTKKWYRSRHGIIFGVCQGLADWKQLPVGMLRLILILIFFFTAGIVVTITYIAFAIFLAPEPQDSEEDPEWKKRFFS